MDTWLWIVGYLACSVTGFWLFQQDWRRDLDFTFGTALFGGLLSLTGPMFLAVALSLTAIGFIADRLPTDKVLWERHK